MAQGKIASLLSGRIPDPQGGGDPRFSGRGEAPVGSGVRGEEAYSPMDPESQGGARPPCRFEIAKGKQAEEERAGSAAYRQTCPPFC